MTRIATDQKLNVIVETTRGRKRKWNKRNITILLIGFTDPV